MKFCSRLFSITSEHVGVRKANIAIERFCCPKSQINLSYFTHTLYVHSTRYFTSEWLKEVFCQVVKTGGKTYVYLKARCTPSMKVGEKHEAWVIALQSGQIVSAFCDCTAGYEYFLTFKNNQWSCNMKFWSNLYTLYISNNI